MPSPRTPGAGITGALTVTLGGGDTNALPRTGTPLQHRFRRALQLDRAADAALFLGQSGRAERLSHIAAELRAVPQ
jgi:hypothetical protein